MVSIIWNRVVISLADSLKMNDVGTWRLKQCFTKIFTKSDSQNEQEWAIPDIKLMDHFSEESCNVRDWSTCERNIQAHEMKIF